MCVQLLAAMGTADTPGASQISTGGALQTAGLVSQAVGDYAMHATRARMSRVDADAEEATAAARAQRIREAGRRTVGQSRADAVGAGVSVASASVLEAQAAIDRGSELDAMSAILSGQNAARGLRSSATLYKRAGAMSALNTLAEASNTWTRTRRKPVDYIGGASARDPEVY